jgi:deoxyribodipyrimidine photo-lyase
MHNRVRMIVGSFLTKNLGIHWREGARWFFDTLVDADLASNTLGWQWVAGCGTDAAPYFRIFNPDTQAGKFDPAGRYITRWLGDSLQPPPIIDLKLSRTRALERYQQFIRQNSVQHNPSGKNRRGINESITTYRTWQSPRGIKPGGS